MMMFGNRRNSCRSSSAGSKMGGTLAGFSFIIDPTFLGGGSNLFRQFGVEQHSLLTYWKNMDSGSNKRIPLFPLNILPCAGRVNALHILSHVTASCFLMPSRKTLLFGVFCNHALNEKNSVDWWNLEVWLNAISRRSDIIVKSAYRCFWIENHAQKLSR